MSFISRVARNLFDDDSDDDSPPLKRPRESEDASASASASWSQEDLLSPVVGEQLANQVNVNIYKGTHRIDWKRRGDGEQLRRSLLDGVGNFDSVDDLPAEVVYEMVDAEWVPVELKWYVRGSPGRRDDLPYLQIFYPNDHTHAFFWTGSGPFNKIRASEIMTLDFARKYLGFDLAKNPRWWGNLEFRTRGHRFLFEANGAGGVVLMSLSNGTRELDSLEGAPAEVIYQNGVLESKKWFRNDQVHRDPVAGPAIMEKRPDGGFNERYFVNDQELTPEEVRRIKLTRQGTIGNAPLRGISGEPGRGRGI